MPFVDNGRPRICDTFFCIAKMSSQQQIGGFRHLTMNTFLPQILLIRAFRGNIRAAYADDGQKVSNQDWDLSFRLARPRSLSSHIELKYEYIDDLGWIAIQDPRLLAHLDKESVSWNPWVLNIHVGKKEMKKEEIGHWDIQNRHWCFVERRSAWEGWGTPLLHKGCWKIYRHGWKWCKISMVGLPGTWNMEVA